MAGVTTRWRAREAGRLAGLVLVLAVLAGCTAKAPTPGENAGPVEPVAAAVATALGTGHLATAPVTDPALAESDYQQILRGMDGILPKVEVGPVRIDNGVAHVHLTHRWALPGSEWSYATEAPFIVKDGRWVLQWGATVIHPKLTDETRLVHNRVPATRGRILGHNGAVLMSQVPVLRLGIDKSRVSGAQALASAGQLADLLKIDRAGFVARVRSAGEKAFVEALVVRTSRTDLVPGFGSIAGAVAVDAERVVSADKGLAANVLGVVGEATAEVVTRSKGAILAGELVGLTGLQQRYDEQLRGKPGSRITLAPRPPAPPTASPEPGATASPTRAPTVAETGPRPVLLETAPTNGADLRISLDPALQRKAQDILVPVGPPAAMAVIDNATGGVLVLAVSASAKEQTLANTGRYAPGSTFKIVTALALLRAGLTPNSPVDCPRTTVVDGRIIKNYNDFPADRVGRMRLVDAIALSCNTAFVNERGRLSGPALRDAAISLGMGQDHDAGFPSFFGSVPDPKNVVGLAEASFGQGTVEGSPMSMAAVAASVAAGRTLVPYLIDANKPTQQGKPLTPAEAASLRTMMQEVVRAGSGRTLRGLATGAKTGTAEYGGEVPPKTHAWMIAYNQKYSIAVMVTDGASGSGTAGPLIKQFLS